jgi:hypothetical protein
MPPYTGRVARSIPQKALSIRLTMIVEPHSKVPAAGIFMLPTAGFAVEVDVATFSLAGDAGHRR